MSTEERNQAIRTLQESFGWKIALGVVMIILGIVAIIALPIFVKLAIERLLGWIFVVSGIVQLIHAFQTYRSGPFLLRLGLSILYVIAGGLLLQRLVGFPAEGVVFLSLLVGILFLVDGIGRVILAFQLKPVSNWGWVLVNGIVTLILGIFISSQSSTIPWVIGLLVGIGLFVNGLSQIMLSMAARHTLSEASS